MDKRKKSTFLNLIIAIGPIIIAAVILGVFGDYFYELNDDVLMKDILSGMYDGTPSGYNMQILWPLGAFIALLYRICGCIPWYGLILLLFQYGSLSVINYNLIKNMNLMRNKIMTALSVTVAFVSFMIFHMTVVQYTVTVSMMAGAAIAIIATSDAALKPEKFLKSNISAIIILMLGFMLRSEMMLLMSPFVLAIMFFKWSFEHQLFSRETLGKYFSVILVTVGLFMILLAADKIAYSSKEWSQFVDLFNARTELYDYQIPPEYEGNEDFYRGIDLTKEEAVLFENYNYGIDSKVDNRLIWQVAKYAGTLNKESISASDKLKNKLKIYFYEFTHVWNTPGADYPWNIAVIALYILCAVMFILNDNPLGIWRIVLLFAGRSAIWLYLLMGERTPERITDSLYFVETVTLLFLFVLLCKKTVPAMVSVLLGLVMGIVFLIGALPELEYLQQSKETANLPYLKFYEYAGSHNDNFYLMDTYSSVAYSEKMFDSAATIDKSNSSTLGGWISLSPIEKEKLSKFGIDNISNGLLKDNVFFVKKADIDSEWLGEYYSSMGIVVDIELEDTVDEFEIYSVRANNQ